MLSKRQQRQVNYIEVKYFGLWRGLKQFVEGCDVVEVNNPRTGERVTKYGHKFDEVTGFVVKAEKYDTGKQYSTRYFGYKLHMLGEGGQTCVLDMPYKSRVFSRFIRAAENMNFQRPLTLTVFKGFNEKQKEDETVIWFRQDGQTVRAFHTREQPNGMPAGVYDDVEEKWDFSAQHRWLVERFRETIIPRIEAAAASVVPSAESHDVDPMLVEPAPFGGDEPRSNFNPDEVITDDDVPF